MAPLRSRLALASLAVLLAGGPSNAAEIRVLSGNGARAAVQELVGRFERATGHKVNLHFEVNATLKRRIEAGEAFDVAVLYPAPLDALIRQGRIVAGTRAVIGRIDLGVAVKAGAQKPDISTVEAFKRTLLAASSVAFPGEGASGRYFASQPRHSTQYGPKRSNGRNKKDYEAHTIGYCNQNT